MSENWRISDMIFTHLPRYWHVYISRASNEYCHSFYEKKTQTWRIIINLFSKIHADSVSLSVYAEFYLFCISHIHTEFRDLQCNFVLEHFLSSDRLQFQLQFSKLCRNNHHMLLKFAVNTKEWEWSSKVLKCKDALFLGFFFAFQFSC